MVLNDTVANALSKIDNARKALYKQVEVKSSKLVLEILEVLKKNGYVGDYEVTKEIKGNFVNLNLVGTINKCGVIKPRFFVKIPKLEDIEKKFLPAKDFGVLVISTNKGLLTQKEAREANVGGVLVAYCY